MGVGGYSVLNSILPLIFLINEIFGKVAHRTLNILPDLLVVADKLSKVERSVNLANVSCKCSVPSGIKPQARPGNSNLISLLYFLNLAVWQPPVKNLSFLYIAGLVLNANALCAELN